MNNKEITKEIKYGGFTATPSDYECPDGDLAAVVNLVPEEGTLNPVLPPASLFYLPIGMGVLFIHQTSDYKHYIIWGPSNDGIAYYYLDDADIKNLDKPVSASAIAPLLHTIDFTSDALPLAINAVGNTLVVSLDDGLHYILWTTAEVDGQDVLQYEHLGQKPPQLEIGFGLNSEMSCWPMNTGAAGGGEEHAEPLKLTGQVNQDDIYLPFVDDGSGAYVRPRYADWTPGPEFHNAWNYSIEGYIGRKGEGATMALATQWTDYALGLVNRFVEEKATKKGKFAHPFLVRWAYELYDGSLVMHSDPVLLIPNSKYPFVALDGNHGFSLKDTGNDNVDYMFWGRAYGFVSQLTAKIFNVSIGDTSILDDLNKKWKDIVSSVNIYVSAPIYRYDQAGKVCGWTNMDEADSWDDFYTVGKFDATGYNSYKQWQLSQMFQVWNEASGGQASERYYDAYRDDGQSHPLPSYILTMPEKTEKDVLHEIETGSFYKIASFKVDDNELARWAVGMDTVTLDDGVLQALLAREAMKDDYHSRDILKGNYAFTYNGRVNLSGIERTIHNPLSPRESWPMYDRSPARSWKSTVELKFGTAASVVESAAAANGCDMPRYVFFPDIHAKYMYIQYDSHKWKLPLTEHPFLEGAYWFGGFAKTLSVTEMASGDIPPSEDNTVVKELSKVYTSETYNPFYFPLGGINTVGTGEILGICAATRALSQGQFGQFPLYAFTTDGVWALEAKADGTYSAVQPITRDVCINPDSITQTDTGVLFATDRGIMLISGSQTVCVSETLDSKQVFNIESLPNNAALLTVAGVNASDITYAEFREFLTGCRIIYDYVNQRYIVYNPTKVDGSLVYSYAYIYSLKSHKWGLMQSDIVTALNSYPEALVQTDDNKLADLSADDTTTGIKGIIITRPLKLEPMDALKTVDTIIQRGYFDYADTTRSVKPVQQVLYGSRDLFNWELIWSSTDQYLRGFRGTPYKYFRLALICDLKKDESLYGCTVRYTIRQNNQPR